MSMRTRTNIDSNVVLRKVETKITQGPVLRRAAFGDIGNKHNVVLAKKAGVKQVSRSVSSISNIDSKKALIKKAELRPAGKENAVVGKKPIKSDGDERQLDADLKTLGKQKQVVEKVIPEDTKASIKEEQLAKAFSAQLLNVEDIDSQDADNPQLVSEYVNDIYKYLRTLEDNSTVKEKYLSNSKEVTAKMRTILIDWLVQVHLKFNLLQETLYLTVAILDRYLQFDPSIAKSNLQLVGVTAVFIASKYEEMYCPEVGDFAYITDKAFTTKQILSMEVKMLTALEYNVSFPLPLHFLRRNSKAGMVEAKQHNLAKYFMELCLPDYSMCHYKPSTIAAAALCLSLKLLEEEDGMWNDTLIYYSNYSEKEIAPVMSKMAEIVLKSPNLKQQAIRNKYKSAKLMKISTIPQLTSKKLVKLASKSVL